MEIILQIIINSLVAGSIYGLVAVGFSLIYSTNRFAHFSHGGVIISSGYFLYWLTSSAGLPLILAAILTILFAGLLGVFINNLIYLPLRKRDASNSILLIASVVTLTLLQALLILLFGSGVKSLNFPWLHHSIGVSGAYITPVQLLLVASSIVVLIVVSYILKGTRLGKTLRAVADNPTLAETVGIPKDTAYNWSFFIGSAIGGVAAIFIVLEQSLLPTMGITLIIKGFAGAVIGGLGSVSGAIYGSLIIGAAENIGVWFFPSGYKDAITYALLFAFLLVRPSGLLGRREP